MSESVLSTILLVEDEAPVAIAEKGMLERNGYTVVTVQTGEQAVELFDSGETIDLVLMDIELGPGMDGTEAASIILSNYSVPVVFLSSHTEAEVVEKTERITSYGYVVKNSGETVLLAAIRTAFRLYMAHEQLRDRTERMNQALLEKEASEKALIEKSKERERRLVERERNLRITLESIGDAVISTDNRGCVVRMNSAAERLCGWSRDEASGERLEKVFRIVNAYTRTPHDNPVEKVLKDGHVVGLAHHTVLISKDGGEYQIADSAAPIIDDRDDIQGVVLVFRDVTEQYEKDSRLRERVKELECLYRISAIVEQPDLSLEDILQKIAETIPSSWRYSDSAACRITLGDREYRSEGFAPSRWEISADVYVDARKAGCVSVCYLDERPSADEGQFLQEERRLLDAVAERLGHIVERKRGEETLQHERNFLSTILETVGEAIVICDEYGRISRFNEAARRLHGVPEKAIPVERWAEHYSLYEVDGRTPLASDRIPLYRALAGERVRGAEIVVSPAHGSSRVLSCTADQLVDTAGAKRGAVVVMHDVTERKETETHMRALAAENERLVQEVQHRIKNTMSTMVGLLDMQANELKDNPDASAVLTDARNRFKSMEVLYDQLYRGEVHEKGSVKEYLTQLLHTVVAFFPAGESVRLNINIEDFELDSKRLTAVGIVVNELVTNAMKYGVGNRDGGELSLSARRSGDQVVVAVHDDGGSFPESEAIDTNSGFGMSMVHALTQQLGGTLRFSHDGGVHVELQFPA